MRDYNDEEREDFARQDGVQMHRQRRSPPRLPAGTVRIHGENAGGCIPLETADFLTERETAIYHLIQGELLNVIRHGVEQYFPVPDDFRDGLSRAAGAIFGCDPDDAPWLVPFLTELEVGRGERLALETREVDPSKTNLRPLAEDVLARTRRRAQRLAPSIELPSWLSARLTVLLLKRFSFSHGGGKDGALAKESIRALLADPCELAKYLRADADRASIYAGELGTLDAINSNDDRRQSSTRRARSVVVDEEHLSASERREARRAAQRGSSLSRVASSQMVWSVNGFVTVHLDPRFPEAHTTTWAT